MSDPLDQFRTAELKPEGYSKAGHTFQLTADSVSPQRRVGVGRFGEPIYETLCHNKGRHWVHPTGTINLVPMRTGVTDWETSASSNYEAFLTRDLLLDGWIPLDVCPMTMAFQSTTGTRCLVDNPERVEDCGGGQAGKPCAHLAAVMAGRAAMAKAKFSAEQNGYSTMKSADVAGMMASLIQGIQDATKAPAGRRAQSTTA